MASTLTATLALLWARLLSRPVVATVPIGRQSAVWHPGPVHAPLHPLHDQVQQHVHSLTHVTPLRRTRLKVRDPARGEIHLTVKSTYHMNNFLFPRVFCENPVW